MVDGGKLLFQLVKSTVGFIAAVLSCGLFLAWGFFQDAGTAQDPVAFAAMIGTGLVTASVLGGFAMIPGLIAIAVAELLSWRGVVYHVGAAGLIALGVWTLDPDAAATAIRPGTTIALAAGFLAGFVYWVIAGRTSGSWRVTSD